MDSISLAKQFQWLLCKFDSEDGQTSEKELENIINQSDKQVNLLFSRIFCNFIPSRSTRFNKYATLFTKVPSLSNPEFKDIFLTYLQNYLLEPNQPEICEFFSFLIESKYIGIDKAFEILISLFQSAEKLQNLQFLQFLYCIFRIQDQLKAHTRYPELMNEFKIRYENIKIGVNLDENSEIYSFLYDQLLNPEKNPIKNIIADESEKIPNFEVLDPTLYVSPSILSFSPPISCVCAFYGAIKTLKSLSKEGRLHADDADDDGRTLCQFAAAGGNIAVLKYLKETIKADFSNSLDYAIEYFQDEAFEYITSLFPLSPTSLHSAAKVNNISKFEFFISKNFPLENRDEYNWTPLHIAASHDSCEIIKILTSKDKVNVNITDLDGETPLHCASKDGYINSMKILLNHPKILPNLKDREGATPLHWAVINDKAEAVRLLIKNEKVDVNEKDNFQRSALLLAAASNSPNAMRVLLSSGRITDANAADQRLTTPLIASCESKSVECIKLIIDASKTISVDFNKRNVDGVTALDVAAFSNSPEIVRLLLGVEAVDASDLNKQSAKKQLSKEIVQIIDEYFSSKNK